MQDEGINGKEIEGIAKQRSRKATLETMRSKQKERRKTLSERENELMSALSLIDDLVFILDENGIFIGHNQSPGASNLYVPPKQFLGKSFKQVLPTPVSKQFSSAIKVLLAENTIQEFDYCLESKVGVRWYRAKLSKRIDSAGEFAGIIAICRDITERRKAENSLRFTQFAIDQVSDAAFWILPDAKFIYINDAACRLLGYSREELLNMSVTDIGPAFTLESWPDYWKKLKQRGSFSFESDCRTRDGRIIPVEITGNFMEFGGNQYNCAFVRDITERKRAENSLRFTQFAVDQVSDAAFWILPDARFIYINNAACRLLGYSRDELFNMSANDIAPEFSKDSWPDCWSQLKQRGSFSFESDCRTKDGKILPVEITGNFMEFGGNQYNCAFVRDITERKKAEDALRASRDYLERLTDSMWDTVFSVRMPDRVIEWVNDSFGLTGYEPEDCIGRTTEFLYPAKSEFIDFGNKLKKAIKAGEDVLHAEQLLRRKNGEVFPAEITTTIFREKGQVKEVTSIVGDISIRKKAEQALRDSEERYKRLSELTLEGIALHDSGVLIDINTAFARMFGYEVDELKGKDLLKIIPAGEYVNIVREKIATGYTKPYEILARRKDGEIFPFEVEAREVILKGKKLRVAAIRDITQRKKAEKRLLDYQAQLKSLASELTLAEEHERRRIAMELHDQISQSLAVSKIKLDALRVAESSTVILDVLNEVSDSLMQVIHDTRSLTFDLSFPILYELGFEAAVAAWLAEQIEDKHGIETEFEEDDQLKPLDDDVRVLLFRDVRELLINVVKHAHAKKVKVCVSRVGGRICVSVQDDGVGFEPTEVAQRSAKGTEFGLFSIRERLEQIGGQLKIESISGCGCKVTITAPLKVE